MKFHLKHLVVFLGLSLALATEADVAAEEEAKFWARVIQETSVTPAPTPPPPPAPTPAPTPPPVTPAPTAPCELSLSINCTLADGSSCEGPLPTVEVCEGRPLMMGMRYNGGNCAQSFNSQPDKFSCEDFQGGPPTESGAESFILVTDAKGKDVVYHNDYVAVDTIYYLTDNNQRFEADQFIYIYSSNVTTEENLLQFVQYHSSCSSNLLLLDRFGASQLVEWYNEEQGLVTIFSNITYNFQVSIPLELEGDNITLTSLVLTTNFAGVIDLTAQVNGVTIDSGDSITIAIPNGIDLSVRQRYTLLVNVAGVTDTGKECSGVEFLEFTAGTAIPPVFPTFTPVDSPVATLPEPVGSPGPTTAAAPTVAMPTAALPPALSDLIPSA